MSFLADICKCAREQARLELDSMAVAVPGGGGAFGPCPQRPFTGDQHIFCPQTEAGPPGPAWAPSWGRFLSGFQGPAGRTGPLRKNQGSIERTRAPRDGPARLIRVPQDRSGPVGRIRAPQDRSWPVRRIKALRDKSGTTERIRASQYESGPRRTDQGPERRSVCRATCQTPLLGAGLSQGTVLPTVGKPGPGDIHNRPSVQAAADALNRHFATVGSRIAEELGDAVAAGRDSPRPPTVCAVAFQLQPVTLPELSQCLRRMSASRAISVVGRSETVTCLRSASATRRPAPAQYRRFG